MAGSRTRSFWTRRPNPCCCKRLDRPATDHSAEGRLDRVGPEGCPKTRGRVIRQDCPHPSVRGIPNAGPRADRLPLQARRMSHLSAADRLNTQGSGSASGGSVRARCEDFATVRNCSAHTTEDAQPRSQTVMTWQRTQPADLESVPRQPSGVRISLSCSPGAPVDHVVQHQSTVNDPG
jgi:hypothetical protein